MERTIIDGVHKIEIVYTGNGIFKVTYYELMGNRYVQLGPTETWSREAVFDAFGK